MVGKKFLIEKHKEGCVSDITKTHNNEIKRQEPLVDKPNGLKRFLLGSAFLAISNVFNACGEPPKNKEPQVIYIIPRDGVPISGNNNGNNQTENGNNETDRSYKVEMRAIILYEGSNPNYQGRVTDVSLYVNNPDFVLFTIKEGNMLNLNNGFLLAFDGIYKEEEAKFSLIDKRDGKIVDQTHAVPGTFVKVNGDDLNVTFLVESVENSSEGQTVRIRIYSPYTLSIDYEVPEGIRTLTLSKDPRKVVLSPNEKNLIVHERYLIEVLDAEDGIAVLQFYDTVKGRVVAKKEVREGTEIYILEKIQDQSRTSEKNTIIIVKSINGSDTWPEKSVKRVVLWIEEINS
jgi:hypothetical protein